MGERTSAYPRKFQGKSRAFLVRSVALKKNDIGTQKNDGRGGIRNQDTHLDPEGEHDEEKGGGNGL